MPLVNGKEFPYTAAGMKAAKKAAKKVAAKKVVKRVAKKSSMVRKKGM